MPKAEDFGAMVSASAFSTSFSSSSSLPSVSLKFASFLVGLNGVFQHLLYSAGRRMYDGVKVGEGLTGDQPWNVQTMPHTVTTTRSDC